MRERKVAVGRVKSILWTAVVLASLGCASPAREAPGGPSSAAPGVRPEPAATAPKRIAVAVVSNVPTLVDRMTAGGVGVPGLTDVELMVSPGFSIVDDQGQQRAVLAEAAPSLENGLWKTFPDGRMETVWRIRPNVRWHDGSSFTGDDALFTATVDRDADVPMRRNLGYRSVDGVVATDPLTVTVTWKQPYIQADALFSAPFLPRHLVERAYNEEKASFGQIAYWTEEFVGTGPFRVQEFGRGTHILLRAYEGYVLGRPKIDEVEVRFIPDQNAIVASVLGGSIDLTLGRGISLEQALQLRDQWRDGKVDIAFTSWIVTYPQFLNPSPAIVGDERFRRALMHGVDRGEMAETLQAGLVPVAHTFIHPNDPEYREVESRIARYEYDPRRSSQMIEDLGYVRGADGYRDAAGGRLAVEIRTSPEQDIQVKTILVLADHWKRVGVSADPVVMAEQRVRDREYVQTFPAFMTYRQPNAPNALLLRLYSSQTPLPDNNFVGRNHPRYMNPAFDALIDRYYTTIPRAERTQVLGEIVNHTTDRLTLMGLFFDVEPVLVGNRLLNVAAARATDSTPVWNAERWDVR